MEFECANFRQALKDYSVALGRRLEQEALQSNNISTQVLCERIMELVPLAESTLPTGLGPAADADPADFLAFALCVLSLCEMPDVQMILWQQVADLVAVKQQTYPWISHALDQLERGYSHAGAHSSAAEACLVHSRMNTSLYVRVGQLSRALYHWHKAGELGKALKIVEERIIPTLALLDASDWELHARLQISAASFFDVVGRSDEAFALRQAAADLVSCRGLSSSTEYKLHEDLLKGVVSLLENYFHRNSWLSADRLVNSFDTQIHKHFSGTAKWKQWQMLKAEIAHVQGEYKGASTIFREVIEILEGHVDPEPELQHYISLLHAIVVENASNGNWKVVLKKSQQMLEELRKRPPCLKIKYIEMQAHILSAMAFNHIGAGGKGKAELEIAEAVKLYETWILSGEQLAGDDHNRYARLFAEGLAGVHLMQAHTALRTDHEAEKAWNLTQVAESLLSSGKYNASLADVKYIQALVRKKQEQWREAAKLARESVIMEAIFQRKLWSLEPKATTWNWFFCENMKAKFWLLQDLYITLNQPEISLLWAERSNMRCFLHQINTQPLETPLLNPADLDECDTLLQSVILITARSLSATSAIIHYSYNPNNGRILMYVVKHSPPETSDREKGLKVSVKVCDLPTWFRNAGLPHTTGLEAVIKKARTDIQNKADKKGQGPIKDLCTLHSLLIEFIEEDLENCDTLIIAPGHGCLSLVPFAALTDLRTGKFLVQSKAIALIPSIMTLHHCLHRQLKFEMSNQLPVPGDAILDPCSSCCSKWVPSQVAFIAGNPEPMGLGLPQLENARFEVNLVASYFGVQPCLGENMSKKAVLEGLASSSVVLLATHGIVDDWYPYGCLVMKGPEAEAEAGPTNKESYCVGVESGKSSAGMVSKGKGKLLSEGCGGEEQASSSNSKYGYAPELGHRIFKHRDESSQRREEEEEVLTAAEIAGVEGGIRAGMVVLSACESGLGEETESEGVLGLGRALLQGGAACALLTLWKVDDAYSMTFMTGLFHSAFIDPSTRGKTVCECLQLKMQGSIQCGAPIEHWAPLQLMGSPLLRLSMHQYDIKETGASWLDECGDVLFDSFYGARCWFPCRVCDRKFEAKYIHINNEGETFTVHPYIGGVVQKYARPLFDQLPPLEDNHVLVNFSNKEFQDAAFLVSPDGNVRQVVNKQVNINPP